MIGPQATLHPAYAFSAYPGTVAQIKPLAAAAALRGTGQLLPFLVILRAKSRLAYAEMQLILRTMGKVGKIDRDLASVGTPHMAQFVPLGNNELEFFTVYDGHFNKYIADFTRNIGEAFDVLFKLMKGAPPSLAGIHRLCRGGEQDSYRLLSGLSQPQ